MTAKLNVSDFARHVGVSHAAVHHAIKRGRLSKSISKDAKGRTWVDVAIGSREWGGNADLEQRRNDGAGGRPAQPTSKSGQASLFPGADPVSDRPLVAEFGGKTIAQWKATQMALQTRNEQLDLAEREGKLADVAKIKAEWFTRVRRARDRLLIIADRIDGQCAAESDQARVHALIDAEIRAALEELTADGR